MTCNPENAKRTQDRMNAYEIARLDHSSEGLIVTFGDGHTFLFPPTQLFTARLRYGQLIETPKQALPPKQSD